MRHKQPFITLNLNNNSLPPYNKSVKYLGIYIDKQLNFKCHIDYIEQKISRAVGILAKLKLFLPKPAFLKLYYALVHSSLLHGLAIWGSTFPSYMNKLASLQIKAVKLVAGGIYRDHVTPFYCQLNILKLSDSVKHETAKIVHCHPGAYLGGPWCHAPSLEVARIV